MAVRVRPPRAGTGGRACLAALLVAAALLLPGCLDAPYGPPPGWDDSPLRLVAYGDSFTAGQGDVHEWNWATGTASGARSVLQRLQEAVPGSVGFNAAIPGARFADLALEVALGPSPAHMVLIFLGLNDVCLPQPRFDAARFREAVQEGLRGVHEAHPGASVLVFAVPDVTSFRSLHHSVPEAAEFWASSPYCTDAFHPEASESSTRSAQARVATANSILREEAGRRGFVFSTATVLPGFELDELSSGDFFHPNEAGEMHLADIAWPSVAEAEDRLGALP